VGQFHGRVVRRRLEPELILILNTNPKVTGENRPVRAHSDLLYFKI